MVLLLAGVLVIAVGFLFAWQIFLRPAVATHQPGQVLTTTSPSSTGSGGLTPKGPPPMPLSYYQTFEQQVAQGLHLTVPEVKAQIQSTFSLFAPARTQGLTQQQTDTLII